VLVIDIFNRDLNLLISTLSLVSAKWSTKIPPKGEENESSDEFAHKVAWSAVEKVCEKDSDGNRVEKKD
jgi:cation transport regulator ChaB